MEGPVHREVHPIPARSHQPEVRAEAVHGHAEPRGPPLRHIPGSLCPPPGLVPDAWAHGHQHVGKLMYLLPVPNREQPHYVMCKTGGREDPPRGPLSRGMVERSGDTAPSGRGTRPSIVFCCPCLSGPVRPSALSCSVCPVCAFVLVSAAPGGVVAHTGEGSPDEESCVCDLPPPKHLP